VYAHIPKKYLTYELCLAAVIANPLHIQYVPKQMLTKEMYGYVFAGTDMLSIDTLDYIRGHQFGLPVIYYRFLHPKMTRDQVYFNANLHSPVKYHDIWICFF
jgi:TM2 domain-containing membrane protein YozV